MDKKLADLAKLYAIAMVNYYQIEKGDANRVPEERREASKQLQDLQRAMSIRAQEVALGK